MITIAYAVVLRFCTSFLPNREGVIHLSLQSTVLLLQLVKWGITHVLIQYRTCFKSFSVLGICTPSYAACLCQKGSTPSYVFPVSRSGGIVASTSWALCMSCCIVTVFQEAKWICSLPLSLPHPQLPRVSRYGLVSCPYMCTAKA